MNGRIRVQLGRLRASYWFIPGGMTSAAALGSLGIIAVDRRYSGAVPRWALAFTGAADGAREVLSTVASSIITVAGVTFSIAIVAMSLAAQQYGPRLLRNFLRDTPSQLTFGTFGATFVQSLLTLRVVRAGDDRIAEFVPNLGVTVSILLAIASIFVLIYFIDHTARTIQAAKLAEATAKELRSVIEAVYPARRPRAREAQLPRGGGMVVAARASGYVQSVDTAALIECATKADAKVDLMIRPGSFVIEGDTLALVRPPVEALKETVREAVSLGVERTMEQDPDLGFSMLAEMAVRALSPSLNDPYTALHCIDRLREGFAHLAQRTPAASRLEDQRGNVRLEWPVRRWSATFDETVSSMLTHAAREPLVLAGLRRLCSDLEPVVTDPTEIAAIRAKREAIDALIKADSPSV